MTSGRISGTFFTRSILQEESKDRVPSSNGHTKVYDDDASSLKKHNQRRKKVPPLPYPHNNSIVIFTMTNMEQAAIMEVDLTDVEDYDYTLKRLFEQVRVTREVPHPE